MPVLERERRDALAPPGARGLGPERRAARLDVSGAGDDSSRAVAQTETEQPHRAASLFALAAAGADKSGSGQEFKFDIGPAFGPPAPRRASRRPI
jgi:hypothetical protein